jgi:hypothetical protein
VYFYAYYVAKIIAGIFCEGSVHCLCLAYVVKTSATLPGHETVNEVDNGTWLLQVTA